MEATATEQSVIVISSNFIGANPLYKSEQIFMQKPQDWRKRCANLQYENISSENRDTGANAIEWNEMK